MQARTKKLLAFMLDAPDGKYEATRLTDEQLAAVLPYIVDKTIGWAQVNGHCDTVSAALVNLIEDGRWNGTTRLRAADGRDCYGYDHAGYNKDGYNAEGWNAEGYNLRGFNRDGWNKAGFNRYGYDKAGFNEEGFNEYGDNREQAAAKLAKSWTPEYLALVAAKLAARKTAAAAAEPAAETVEEAPVTDEALQPVVAA